MKSLYHLLLNCECGAIIYTNKKEITASFQIKLNISCSLKSVLVLKYFCPIEQVIAVVIMETISQEPEKINMRLDQYHNFCIKKYPISYI